VARRGSPGSSRLSADSSAWTSGPVSREYPLAIRRPAASTMTAPTLYALGEGGHLRDRPMAWRNQWMSVGVGVPLMR
jgi:hypothetical protein